MNAALRPRRIILTTVVNDHFLCVNIVLIPGYESFHFSFGPPLLLTIQEIFDFSTSYKDQRLADYYTFKKRKLGIFIERLLLTYLSSWTILFILVHIRFGFLNN